MTNKSCPFLYSDYTMISKDSWTSVCNIDVTVVKASSLLFHAFRRRKKLSLYAIIRDSC